MTSHSPLDQVFEVQREDLFSGSLLTFQGSGGGSTSGFKLFVASAGLYDERYKNERGEQTQSANFGKPRFPKYGLISEPGGFGSAYHAMTASMQQTGLCVKEQVVSDTSLKEVHTMQALWGANVPAHVLGGRQNLCLCLARGQTHGGTPLMRQRYGMFFVPDERPDFNSLEYFVLPCLEAELRQILHPPTHSTNQLGVEEALAISAQLIRGVAFMHEAGLCHRDIKPDNIMVRSGWRVPPASASDFPGFPADGVQIIDFGLGKPWRADKSKSGSVTFYRAQEVQQRGEDAHFLYPSIQTASSALMLSHSAPEAYFNVAQLHAESHGASASPATAAFPDDVVRGDAYDAWGVGLAVDKVLRGNYNVSHQMRTQAYRYERKTREAGVPPLGLSAARVAAQSPSLAGDFCMMLELVAAGDVRRWYWSIVGDAMVNGAIHAPLADTASVAPMQVVLKPAMPSAARERLATTQLRELPIPGGLAGAAAAAATQLGQIITRMLNVMPQQRLVPLQALGLPLIQRTIGQLLPPGQQPRDVLDTLRRNSSVPMQSPLMGSTPSPAAAPPTLPAAALGGRTPPVNTPQAFAGQGSAAASSKSTAPSPFATALGQPRLPSEQRRGVSGVGGGASQSRGPPGLSLRVMGAASRSTFDGVEDDDIQPVTGIADVPASSAAGVGAAAPLPSHLPPMGGGSRAGSGSSLSDHSPALRRDTSAGSTGSASVGLQMLGTSATDAGVAGGGTGLGMGGGFASYAYPPSGLSRQRTVDSSRDPGESALRQMMRQHTRLSGRSGGSGGAYGGDRPPVKRYTAATHAKAANQGVFAGAEATTRGSMAAAAPSVRAASADSATSSGSTAAAAGSGHSPKAALLPPGHTQAHAQGMYGNSGAGVPVLPSAGVDQVLDRETRGVESLQLLIGQEVAATSGRVDQDPPPEASQQRIRALLGDLQALEKQCGNLKAQLQAAFDQQRRLADNSGLTHSAGCLPHSAVEQLVQLVGESRQTLYAQAKSKTLEIQALMGEA